MKQVIQNIRSGQLSVQTIPHPEVVPGEVLIANQASLISAGTEKMILDLAKKSLLGKARERPDHVRRVREKVRNEGLLKTVQQVRTKLDEPMTMGYSSAGVVLACGQGVQEFKPGDRVASNGPHAEVVSVPRHLCARVPEGVPLDQAAFAVLGSIAMQGVRLARCSLGETAFVIGLGLIGQLTAALLKAAGVRVIGVDLDASRCELSLSMGAAEAHPDLRAQDVLDATSGLGADAVLITASTKSNSPIESAAAAVRPKGRVVLLGVVGLELDRRPFYFKEAEFVVSCSYGPGRYDPNYEERGLDYPAAYVRWTEQRNIQAVLDLMGAEQLDVGPLISHQFPIDRAAEAYELIDKGEEPFLGIVLDYPKVTSGASWGMQENSVWLGRGRTQDKKKGAVTIRSDDSANRGNSLIRCGVLGAGNFARMVLLPAIQKSGRFEIAKICSAKGLRAAHAGEAYGAEAACSNESEVFNDESIDAVFSITRHDQHARHVLRAIEAGKSIFSEKPLCVSLEELEQIEDALVVGGDDAPLVMVGFNRRFSKAATMVRESLADVRGPLTISIRFNAGEIPADHWTQHDAEGGGRIIGEACHAIDLATYLCGSPVVRVFAESATAPGPGAISDDQCFITLRHANGSVSSVAYLAGGDKAFPKERIEVFGGGRVAVIDDFRSVTTCHGGRHTTTRIKSGKGYSEEIDAFAAALPGGSAPIPWMQLRSTTLASIMAVRSLREGTPLEI